MFGRKLNVKVAEGMEVPCYAHEGDAGLDLRITETVTLEPMQRCIVGCGYRGEVCAPLINLSYETVTIEAGTRVCQLVVMPYVPCELVPVEELSGTERGTDGFGSTGIE